jgi:hypothetical protein
MNIHTLHHIKQRFFFISVSRVCSKCSCINQWGCLQFWNSTFRDADRQTTNWLYVRGWTQHCPLCREKLSRSDVMYHWCLSPRMQRLYSSNGGHRKWGPSMLVVSCASCYFLHARVYCQENEWIWEKWLLTYTLSEGHM